MQHNGKSECDRVSSDVPNIYDRNTIRDNAQNRRTSIDKYEQSDETDNVIYCTYDRILDPSDKEYDQILEPEKISNMWRFVFHSGIMQLNDQDYIFKDLKGEADW